VIALKNADELRNWAVPKTAMSASAASRNAEKPASATRTRARPPGPQHALARQHFARKRLAGPEPRSCAQRPLTFASSDRP
jgi:hypothetical protein